MEKKWWAGRKRKTVGPYKTLEEAIAAGKVLFPRTPVHRDTYLTGYGEFGPHNDIRFHERASK